MAISRIKEKPTAATKIKEKVTAAPKELARRGLSDGMDRLGRQLREGGQQGQSEDLGQTQLEEGIFESAQRLNRGGEQLLRKAKRSIGRNGKAGTAQADSQSADMSPISSTETDVSFWSERPSDVTAPSSRVKTREAYKSKQMADTAQSGKHFQGKRAFMQERTAEKAVRERAKESAPMPRLVDGVQAGIPGENPVKQGKQQRNVKFPDGRISANTPLENTAPVHGVSTGKRTVGRSVGQQVSREVRQAAKGKSQVVEAAKAAAQAPQAAARKAHAVRQLTGGGTASRQVAHTASRGAVAAVQAVGWTLRAMTTAARDLLASLAAGGSVCVLLVVVLCMIGLLAASPFGILFAGESGNGSVPVSAAVAQVNYDLNARLEVLQSGSYDEVRIIGQPPEWADILAVFAVYVAGVDDPVDVATMDADRIARLKAVFWDMTALDSAVTTIRHPDSDPNDSVDDSYSEKILTITISAKTVEEMAAAYGFHQEQLDTLEELLSQRELLTELAGETESMEVEAKELLRSLPADLSPERRAVVKNACSLVGKVGYYWGGKSLVMGWDSRWGQLRKVTAAGSPTTGTYRLYGLDCSGLVDWAFYNASGGDYIIGHGGGASAQHSYCTSISWSEAQPGDLVFYPGDEHVGIVGGWDENGDLLIIHCASGYNNVVITGREGFTTIARPNYYTE